MNVVSMLSISRHCISYNAQTSPDHADGFLPQAHKAGVTIDSLRDSTLRLKALAMLETVERSQTWNSPWLMIRQTWDKGLLGTFCELRETKNTLDLGGSALIFLTFLHAKYPKIHFPLQRTQDQAFFLKNGHGLATAFFHHHCHLIHRWEMVLSHAQRIMPAPHRLERRMNHPIKNLRGKKSHPSTSPCPPHRTNRIPLPMSFTSFFRIQHSTTQSEGHDSQSSCAMVHYSQFVLFSILIFNAGLYGFDARGPTSFPSMRMHYWSNVLRVLRGVVGAEVIVTSVPGFVTFPTLHFRVTELN